MQDPNIDLKYFLKCEQCGYLTEIKGERHTWCFNCTQQFPNYFKKWAINNKGKSLDQYKEELCDPYTFTDIKWKVDPENRKTLITSPTKEQIQRRAYIKQGIPLDRGGHTTWDLRQIKMYFIGILILSIVLALIITMISYFS